MGSFYWLKFSKVHGHFCFTMPPFLSAYIHMNHDNNAIAKIPLDNVYASLLGES